MFIAQELRKSNIAEYLLYMWQVEDTIRAFGCSLSRIRHEYIDRFDYTDEQKEEETDWFGNLIRMMNSEGCREQGHIQINKVVMQQLQELHAQLLSSSKFPFYNAEYYKVLPYIVELRNHGANKEENEIETCFNSLYGVMLLRLQKKEITTNTQHAVKEISTFIGMLNDILVTGCNGQLGNEMQLLEKEYPQHSWFNTDVEELDITSQLAVEQFVAQHQIDGIVNCAAYTAVDKAEDNKEQCTTLNTVAPSYLAAAVEKRGGWLVQISTDYVFNGTKYTPYVETDTPCPDSVYGSTKLAGELGVSKFCKRSMIIRTGVGCYLRPDRHAHLCP